MAAAALRDVSGGESQRDGSREARITYQAAWLRFMVSLCNLPLADRPVAVEHLIEALRMAHLLRQQGELDPPGGLIAPSAKLELPPHGP